MLFLTLISAFDKTLAGDLPVNRLQDSLQLWHAVCVSHASADVVFVLFLIKYDILHAGVHYADHTAYNCNGNGAQSISKHMWAIFVSAHKLHVHTTTTISI